MSKEDPTGLWYVEGRCLCVGSGQEINQEVDQIGEEQEIRMNNSPEVATRIITAMQLQRSTRTPQSTLEDARLSSASSALGADLGFLAETLPERRGAGGTPSGSEQYLGGNPDDNTEQDRPELTAITNSPAVNSAIEKAWQLSNPHDLDSRKRLEHGFYVFETPSGQWVPDIGIVGTDNQHMPGVLAWSRDAVWFHTHPNINTPQLLAGGSHYVYGPSGQDKVTARTFNMPGIIRAPDGLHFYGPPLGSVVPTQLLEH